MFGKVRVVLNNHNNYTVIPVVALMSNTFGTYVYVVHKTPKGLKVEQQMVKVIESRDNLVAVTNLKAGVQIVAVGQVKLRPGALVKNVPAPAGLFPDSFSVKEVK
jgi:multidrug efflux pump subunit AcrA (membrane-fusion protein)